MTHKYEEKNVKTAWHARVFPSFQNTNISMICPEFDISRVVTFACGTIYSRLDHAKLAEHQN
jgi:hypothetical protein